MKLWGGRFKQATSELVDEFTSSIGFDQCLAEVDIQGSLAHVNTLGKAEILTSDEVTKISNGLHAILEKVKQGSVEFKVEDEDIHMNIERMLHAEIGDLAGKLHTGRSRNDQVALDLHIYTREQIYSVVEKLHCLQAVLLTKAKQHIDTILPGYTHLQRAEPVRLAHHLCAYVAMFQRDIERLISSWSRVNCSPLGAGAIAGSGIELDRENSAKILSFDSIYLNSMDAVSDRDFIVEFNANISLVMLHLSRISEELILWSSQEFGFIELADTFCTGSSMMPQKKNPDVPELIRGKTGRVYGALMNILTVLKALPLTYNKDLQEDKEGLFDVAKTVNNSLSIFAPMIETMQVKTEAMLSAANSDYSNATQVANFLVEQGITFRVAHEITGKLVMHCIEQGIYLKDLSLTDYQTFNPLFTEEIFTVIAVENVVDAHSVQGGTGKAAVLDQINKMQENLDLTDNWLQGKSI